MWKPDGTRTELRLPRSIGRRLVSPVSGSVARTRSPTASVEIAAVVPSARTTGVSPAMELVVQSEATSALDERDPARHRGRADDVLRGRVERVRPADGTLTDAVTELTIAGTGSISCLPGVLGPLRQRGRVGRRPARTSRGKVTRTQNQ